MRKKYVCKYNTFITEYLSKRWYRYKNDNKLNYNNKNQAKTEKQTFTDEHCNYYKKLLTNKRS